MVDAISRRKIAIICLELRVMRERSDGLNEGGDGNMYYGFDWVSAVMG